MSLRYGHHFITQIRSFSASALCRTVFDRRVFTEPLTDIEKLKTPLPEGHFRNYKFAMPMKTDKTPVFYRDQKLYKFMNMLQKHGDKELVRKHFFTGLELVKRQQYKKWKEAKSDEERNAIIVDPVVLFHRAIKNCYPLMRLDPVLRGGTIYRVPVPINEKEAEFRAMLMMKKIFRQKAKAGAFHLHTILAKEIIDGSRNKGFTIDAKHELHRQCEANRAYSHYKN
ncbi:ribosomal protein s7p/S5e domain-containing protein [Ditylenchus destructor]|uniref:Ribosomal protein s7p/S5e domain-containing protein n=1 Tax=Ditylenchus destructor TaxID=166010 RepID=A0AAD4RCS8_9BILA|nr:ribosomal protein s7p/S5e domain-containing protein [Ditylenchus destructor]